MKYKTILNQPKYAPNNTHPTKFSDIFMRATIKLIVERAEINLN